MPDPSPFSSGNNSGLASLISHYHRLSAQAVPLVLATVVETLGSTYRKAGARMLISADGRFHGLIGGGCFEGDLYEQTQSVFASGKPRLLFYDMRAADDALWGLGLGCNGAVRVFLQRLADDGRDPVISRLEQILQGDEPRVLVTVCDGPDAGCSGLYDDAALFEKLTSIGSQVIRDETRAVAMLSQSMPHSAAQSALVQHDDIVTVFYEAISPPPRLLLIGAGADAMPVFNLARQLDWRVMLLDHRPANARPDRFAGAEAVIQAHPQEMLDQIAGRRIDAVVLMTHNIDYDARFLKVLTELPCRYLGLLGPRARRDQLFRLSGVTAETFGDRLHAPIGLDIGGMSPESIALSLVAEIHTVLHERDALPLRDKQLPIQSRETAN